jgi:large subunit ribosomal protein L24
MVKKHTRKSQEHPNGAIVEREGPIHISNVKQVEAAKKESPQPKSKAG